MSDEMTNDEKAETIIKSWFWQMSESHSFRWSKAVKSMTLFYESAPMSSDIAQLVVQYLKTREGVTDFIINHKKWHFDSPGWNAKEASYVTAPGEKWNGTESTKVRIYWTLVQAGDGEADGPYTVENGCKYLVTHTYYWDVAEQPALPASSSGVQYSIQGFTRDKETGLFTYIVEKRETVEQSIPLYESAKTIFETVSEQQFLGVKQGSVAGKGLPASVGNGERVERHLQKNADCTTDITNRKVKDHKQEQARVVTQKRLRGTSAATTDRNLTPGEVAAKTSAQQEVGETRTIEKTDTDLRNLTIEKTTPPTLPLTLAKSCEKEESVHTDTTVELVQSSAADGSVEQTAEPNKRKTVSVKKNEDGVTADKTTTTQTWDEKTGGGSSNSGNGVVTTTTTRKENTVTTPTAAPGVNKVVEVEEVPNDHGSKTTVERVTEYHEKTGGGSSNSGGGVVTTTTERKENTVSTPAAAPGVNKVVEIEEIPNDHGSKTTVKRVTEYDPKRETATGGATSRSVRIETGINQTDVPSESPATNKEVEVSLSLNEHGSMTTQKRVTTYSEAAAVATSNFATEKATTIVKTNTTGDAIAAMGQASAQPNEHGSKSTQVTEYTPIAKDSGWITWQSVEESPTHIYTYECGIRIFKNLATVPTAPGGTRVQVSANINRYGLYDGSIAYSKLVNWNVRGGSNMEGGVQTGSINYSYVDDYVLRVGSDGDLDIQPFFRTVTLTTHTYYGRGNEGSEAQAAANCGFLPGLHLPHRTYINNQNYILTRIKRAEIKLQEALANRKPRGT